MSFDLAQGAIIGARKNQEDSCAASFAADGTAVLAVVADGMGGHAGGEVASMLAAAAFVDWFDHYTCGPVPRRLAIGLAMVNQALAERVQAEIELDGMGTTLLAVHCVSSGLHWASVGDSPLLLVRDGTAQRLNADHSMAPVIERRHAAGLLTRDEADRHPERSHLLSVLTGLYAPDMIDCPPEPLPLRPGNRRVAASDGLP